LRGRAFEVLKRQLALKERYARNGKINHNLAFFQESGAPLTSVGR
jgi:hypothetical protein